MSRVKKPGKYMNDNRYSSAVTGPSKSIRLKNEKADYTRSHNLSTWLLLKYDMSYKTFRNKSKNRRDELRREYGADTGNDIRTSAKIGYDAFEAQFSFEAYCDIYDKTPEDIAKLSKPLQDAWVDEYKAWRQKGKEDWRREFRLASQSEYDEDREECYEILRSIGVPFCCGEPIGI